MGEESALCQSGAGRTRACFCHYICGGLRRFFFCSYFFYAQCAPDPSSCGSVRGGYEGRSKCLSVVRWDGVNVEALCYLWIRNCRVSLVSWEHLSSPGGSGKLEDRGVRLLSSVLCAQCEGAQGTGQDKVSETCLWEGKIPSLSPVASPGE